MTPRAINWFEIPARDIDRAQKFYEALLERTLHREAAGPSTMAVFPYPEGSTGGCLMTGPGMDEPKAQGTLVYLDASPSLDAALTRATALGGRVATPRTALPPGLGFFAHIVDSEGNRVGLHALA